MNDQWKEQMEDWEEDSPMEMKGMSSTCSENTAR